MHSANPPAPTGSASKEAVHTEELARLEGELVLQPTNSDLRRRYFRLIQLMPPEQALERAYFANQLHAEAVRARFPKRTVLAIAGTAILLLCASGLQLEEATSHLLRSAGSALLGLLLIAVVLWCRWFKAPLQLPEGAVDCYKQPVTYHLALLLGLFLGFALVIGPFLGPR